MKQKELTAKQRLYFRQYRPRHTDRDWDLLRMKVPDLEILSLPIAPLYLEVVGKAWPGKRRPDPIASYFELTYEELVEQHKMKPKEIDLMIDLVSRVVRTEQGEKEMVQSERITLRTNDFFFRTLEKFDVRPDLPIDFIALDEESLNLCAGSSADDLEKVLRQGLFLSEKKFLSGDLKALINAVATESQQLMSRFLPTVPGERGLKPWKAMKNVIEKVPTRFRTPLQAYYSSGSTKVADADQEEFDRICKRLDMIGLEFRALFPTESRAIRDKADDAAEVFAPIQEAETRILAEMIIRGRKTTAKSSSSAGARKPVSFFRGLMDRVGAN